MNQDVIHAKSIAFSAADEAFRKSEQIFVDAMMAFRWTADESRLAELTVAQVDYMRAFRARAQALLDLQG